MAGSVMRYRPGDELPYRLPRPLVSFGYFTRIAVASARSTGAFD
jgi:hypothetical protein